MTEPTTQAGRDVYDYYADNLMDRQAFAAKLAAIEAEAAAAARAEAEISDQAHAQLVQDYWEQGQTLNAASAQLATLAEAAQAFQDMDEYQLGDSYQQYEAAKHLQEALANLPAAAQEWAQWIRAEAYQEGHVKGQGDGYSVAMRDLVEPGRWLDLASPDAERRLAEFQHQSFQQWAGHCGNQTESYDDHMAAHEANVTANLAALASQAASQPAEP